MSVTIRDVAREAGVSVATVSKILNGKPGISEATTRRVEAVMKALDYAPDSRAASLARKSARNIVCLTQLPADIAYKNPHRFDILCGILSELNEKGYTLTLMNAAAEISPGAAVERIVRRKLADGIIFHGVPIDKATAALLNRNQFPHIVIGRPGADSRLCWVEIDQTLGGQIAAEHLLERGYRRIGFLTGPADEEIAYLRLRGFRIAMQGRECVYTKAGLSTRRTASRGAIRAPLTCCICPTGPTPSSAAAICTRSPSIRSPEASASASRRTWPSSRLTNIRTPPCWTPCRRSSTSTCTTSDGRRAK